MTVSAEDVTLRPATEADAGLYARFPPSAEIIRMYGGNAGPLERRTAKQSKAWLTQFREAPFARLIEHRGRPVGHVRLHGLSTQDRKARLAIGLFAEAFLGHGIGRIAIMKTLDEGFGPLGLHRIDLRVLAYNQRAIRCYLACGFVHEGTERQAALIDGAWHDEWIMGCLRPDHVARRAAEADDRR